MGDVIDLDPRPCVPVAVAAVVLGVLYETGGELDDAQVTVVEQLAEDYPVTTLDEELVTALLTDHPRLPVGFTLIEVAQFATACRIARTPTGLTDLLAIAEGAAP